MTDIKIISTHRLAHRAVLAVCTTLDAAGALTETIKNDYGEDLIVQTQLKDVADNFHILVQVKGSKLRQTSSNKHAFSLDVAHLLRWVNHSLPVLVCVFDEVSEKTFAFYPRRMFSSWYLATLTQKRLSVKFSDDHAFNQSTALRFIWECRVEYFSRMLSWYENESRYAASYTSARKVGKHMMLDGNLLVFQFIKSLGIFTDKDQFCLNFRKQVENCSKNFAKKIKRRQTISLVYDTSLCYVYSVPSMILQE